jgi:hypothetical protein
MNVRTVPMAAGQVLLVPGDTHFDCQDDGALAVMLKVARAAKVTDACLVGDTFESAGISRHPQLRKARKFRHGGATIKKEAEAAAPVVAEMRAIVKENRRGPGGLHVLTGNHEHWWAEVQDEYPGLLDTPWFELYRTERDGFIFDGWHVHAEHEGLKYGPLLVCHGQRLRGSLSKYSAASVLANYPGQNTLYGHTHRIDEATTPTYKYGTPSAHGAWTIGHMKRRDVEVSDPVIGPFAERHQQGFGLVHFFDRDGQLGFEVTKVRIHRDTHDQPMATWGGHVFK